MIREEPFPVRRGKETERVWATAVMDCFWRAGYPELLGRAETQVETAREVLKRLEVARRKEIGENSDSGKR